MDDLTRAFVAMVQQSGYPPARWLNWHLQRLGELAADPVSRVELGHALRESPELLESAQLALDSVGSVVAEAALSLGLDPEVGRRVEDLRQRIEAERGGMPDGAVDHRDVPV